MSNEIKFESDGVKKGMDLLENLFTQFADTLSELNNYVETMINAGDDSAILGEYGTKLFQIWSANASSFGDFHANFEAWNEVVAIISANNEEFIVQTVDLYRDSGATLNGVKEARKFVSENGRNGDVSTLSEGAQKVMSNASSTVGTMVGGFAVYKSTDSDGNVVETKKDKDGKVIREIIYDKNGKKIKEMYTNTNGTWVEQEFDSNGKLLSYVQYDSNNNILKENHYENGELVQEGYSSGSLLEVGETTHATAKIGNATFEKEFKLEGFSQRGDMTQEQIFSDEDGNLYYYEEGVMKPVNIKTTTYMSDDSISYSYDKQATMDNLGKDNLYFQDSTGNYGASNANKSYTVNIDTNGSEVSSSGYTISQIDYNNFNKDNYEGKGTTLYYPSNDVGNRYVEAPKEVMTTSVIDVRNTISQEATEMQTYLDINRNSLSSSQIKEIENQISARNTLATQMGTDVQFGACVDDGAIGDYGTAVTSGNSYQVAVDTIKGYETTLDTFKSIDEILKK